MANFMRCIFYHNKRYLKETPIQTNSKSTEKEALERHWLKKAAIL